MKQSHFSYFFLLNSLKNERTEWKELTFDVDHREHLKEAILQFCNFMIETNCTLLTETSFWVAFGTKHSLSPLCLHAFGTNEALYIRVAIVRGYLVDRGIAVCAACCHKTVQSRARVYKYAVILHASHTECCAIFIIVLFFRSHRFTTASHPQPPYLSGWMKWKQTHA